jgi:hypothetical protein
MCTLYDIEAKIPQLYSKDNDEFTEPIGNIIDEIFLQSSIVRQRLGQYITSFTNTIDPYLTYPIARKGNSSNNSILKKPTLLITDSTSIEADTVVVTFTDSTSFDCVSFVGDDKGSGDINTDFTSSDGLFQIKTTDWHGTFIAGDKFTFAYETHENILRILTAYLVASKLLIGRYVSEAANQMNGMQNSYEYLANKIFSQIESGSVKLECYTGTDGQPQSSTEAWQGYNIDALGFNYNYNTSELDEQAYI